MNQPTKHNLLTIIAIFIFSIFTIVWIVVNITPLGTSFNKELFSASYGVMALFGSIVGLTISKKWGGHKSYMGKAIIFLSFGLLAQELGQIVYSIYSLFLHIEIPYPSLGDVGFFGSIPLYILGAFYLGKIAGSSISIRNSVLSKILAVTIPITLLAVSYYFFLVGYEVDFSKPLTVLLDFGYPLGQSVYISLAILTYILTRNTLGGIMKNKILLLLFSFALQYTADFVFLYKTSRGTWETAGINEFMYLVAYVIMTIALINLGRVFEKIQPTQE